MITNFLGRRLLPTTLDPLPERRDFRFAPGLMAINERECTALQEGDGSVFKHLANLVQAEDALEARGMGVLRPYKAGRSTPKLSPSTRLSMINSIYRGRR